MRLKQSTNDACSEGLAAKFHDISRPGKWTFSNYWLFLVLSDDGNPVLTIYLQANHLIFKHNFKTLTISGHPHHQAFLEAALLAPVSVDPHDGAALVLKALFILDVLLDAPSEEALCVDKDRRHKL